MIINEGDLVKRRERPGRMPVSGWGGSITASELFYDGYYLVLKIMHSELKNNKGSVEKVAVCKVMDCFGRVNWIGIGSLIKIS